MYGLTGFQNEVVETIQLGLREAAAAERTITGIEPTLAIMKAKALTEAEGSNETTRKANAELALKNDERYIGMQADAFDAKQTRDCALAEVEAAKAALKLICGNLAVQAGG